jgi:YHS domain-containing protein
MELITYEADGDAVRAGYRCACGCTPSSTYSRGGEVTTHVCCCGNQFAVGRDAQSHVMPREGFHLETAGLSAPWGEAINVAWMVGPSVHPEPTDTSTGDHSHDHGHTHGDDLAVSGGAVMDPVCGMSVEPATALEKGLHSDYKDTDYYFCGKGCKLEFDEDPERYLDPAHVPSM